MFGHPSQHRHMMKGVAAAVKSRKTPKHLKPHLQSRLGGPSTMGPGDDELMQAAQRTPDIDADDSQKAVNPMEESLAQEVTSGGLKRDVSRRGPMQLQRKPPMSRLMKRAVGRGVPKVMPKGKSKPTLSAFMGDFGGRPKGL